MIFLLLVAFQVKHFIADYVTQGPYKLGKFNPGWDFVLPLSAHCLDHAVGTAAICLIAGATLGLAAKLAALDFIMHFSMDRLKASPKLMGRWKPDNVKFWRALGFDQAFHHLTHYLLIWFILKA